MKTGLFVSNSGASNIWGWCSCWRSPKVVDRTLNGRTRMHVCLVSFYSCKQHSTFLLYPVPVSPQVYYLWIPQWSTSCPLRPYCVGSNTVCFRENKAYAQIWPYSIFLWLLYALVWFQWYFLLISNRHLLGNILLFVVVNTDLVF